MFDFGVSALLIEGPFEIGFCAVWGGFFSFKISAHVIRCAGHEILKRLRLPDMNSDELLRKEGRKKKKKTLCSRSRPVCAAQAERASVIYL